MSLLLRRLSRAELRTVSTWFDDPLTRRWLGGPGLPAQLLRLAEDPPARSRGRDVTGRHVWTIQDNRDPVGLVDFEIYADGGAGISIVVAPEARQRGVAKRAIEAVMNAPEARGVERFEAEIAAANLKSVRAFERAGFVHTGPASEDGYELFVAVRSGLEGSHAEASRNAS